MQRIMQASNATSIPGGGDTAAVTTAEAETIALRISQLPYFKVYNMTAGVYDPNLTNFLSADNVSAYIVIYDSTMTSLAFICLASEIGVGIFGDNGYNASWNGNPVFELDFPVDIVDSTEIPVFLTLKAMADCLNSDTNPHNVTVNLSAIVEW